MQIAVPKEITPDEKRVAITPETVGKLVKAGVSVLVQSCAGDASYFPDAAYEAAGALISNDSVFEQSQIIAKVQKPIHNEIDLLRENAVLIGFLQPLLNLELIQKLAARKITSFSMDAVPRITRAQKLDALSSMSTIAGYKAVLLAADAAPKFFPMLMTAAGTIAPARVFVIGAGVAGLQAIATARRLGAVVEAFDTRPAVKEQVESLGAKFALTDMKMDASEAEGKGGYAKELSKEAHQKERELIEQKVKDADVVITTALIPGKLAPRLITDGMVNGMKPGAVIVDLAAEMGGNCELTVPGEEIERHGVKIFGTLNLPSLMPFHASQMYSRNVHALLELLIKNGELSIDLNDDVIREMCITHQGKIQNETVRKMALQTEPAA